MATDLLVGTWCVATMVVPSDYTPVFVLLHVVLGVGSVVAFIVVWKASRAMTYVALQRLVRVLPISVAWSFAPLGQRGDWWPAPYGLLFGGGNEKLLALASIAASTLVLFGVATLFFPRRGR